MVDSFCVPVLLYGLEDLNNKSSIINSIDFAYNGVFVKLFKIKDKYNKLYCQRATKCMPASCKLDMRILYFNKTLISGQASPLASELFQLCGDSVFDIVRDKYNIPHQVKLHKSLIYALYGHKSTLNGNCNCYLC